MNPFNPGENISLKYVSSESVDKTVEVKVPGRIGFVVCDMTTFAPGKPGGGGVGMAVEVFSSAIVTKCASEKKECKIVSPRPLLVSHFVKIFCKVTGENENKFEIKTSSEMKSHTGLGSTSSTVLSVLLGMNELCNRPLTYEHIRQLLGRNYVEEKDDKLVYGYETGMTGVGAQNGGIYVISTDLVPVCNFKFAEDKNVFILVPSANAVAVKFEDEEATLTEGAHQDTNEAHAKAHLILMELIPALAHKEIEKVGDVIWKLQSIGSKKAEIDLHGANINSCMRYLRKNEVEVVGLSSVGPSVAVVTRKSKEEIQILISKFGVEIAHSTKVANSGFQITKL